MSTPALPPDCRTLSAFLCEITGSESGASLDATGLPDSAVHSPAHSPAVRRSPEGSRTLNRLQGNGLAPQSGSPAKLQDCMQQIAELVAELATDLDDAIALGGRLPFSGEDLRAHYRDAVRQNPLPTVLEDLRIRRRQQVECRLPALVLPCPPAGHGQTPPRGASA